MGCEARRQMDLNFDFKLGSCNAFKGQNEKVLMCFNSETPSSCHM